MKWRIYIDVWVVRSFGVKLRANGFKTANRRQSLSFSDFYSRGSQKKLALNRYVKRL